MHKKSRLSIKTSIATPTFLELGPTPSFAIAAKRRPKLIEPEAGKHRSMPPNTLHHHITCVHTTITLIFSL
ncbi:hypothetical protein EON65_19765 [archaeon]|nr:MAG: hypothetical protein EON65_19765 [archaeon]